MSVNPEFHPSIADAALSGLDLFPWDTGPAVAELQELLVAHGFTLRIDGDFGHITEAAVKRFQRQHGLRVDGIVKAETRSALRLTVQAGTRMLRQGHRGSDVFELQGLLKIHGYDTPRTGVFCAQTKQAVSAFQQEARLKADGIVSSGTWVVLRGRTTLPTPPPQTGWRFNARKWW